MVRSSFKEFRLGDFNMILLDTTFYNYKYSWTRFKSNLNSILSCRHNKLTYCTQYYWKTTKTRPPRTRLNRSVTVLEIQSVDTIKYRCYFQKFVFMFLHKHHKKNTYIRGHLNVNNLFYHTSQHKTTQIAFPSVLCENIVFLEWF